MDDIGNVSQKHFGFEKFIYDKKARNENSD